MNAPCVPGYDGDIVYMGKLMLAKTFTRPKTGKEVVNPVGWWMSEKYDGYRALWNGQHFMSRGGKRFVVPTSLAALMPPSVALDGELWLGRDRFQDHGFLRRKAVHTDTAALWTQLKYQVFDMPISRLSFEERQKELAHIVKRRCKECRAVDQRCPLVLTKQIRIKTRAQLDKALRKVLNNGGEGIMLRKPGSLYEPKRSSTLLKIKTMFDAECKIVGYKEGTGKYKGQLGSYTCIWPKNKKKPFHVAGITDAMRRHPLAIGTVITFIYNGESRSKIPRHPRFLRVRDDIGL